jgi:hypothetical protein
LKKCYCFKEILILQKIEIKENINKNKKKKRRRRRKEYFKALA